LRLLIIILDIALILAADSVAYFLRLHAFPWQEANGLITIWPFIVLIRIVYLYAKGFYKNRFRNSVDITLQLLKNITFSSLLIVAITLFYRNLAFSRLVLFYSWLLTFLFLLIEKLILHAIMDKPGISKKVIIIGDNRSIVRVLSEIKISKASNWTVKGVIPSKNAKFESPCLGTLKSFFLKPGRFNADLFLLAVDNLNEVDRLKLVVTLKEKKKDYLVMPTFYELVTGRTETRDILENPILEPLEEPFKIQDKIIKRLFDIIFSLGFIIVFSPVYLMTGLAVLITCGSPIVYKQLRVGKNGKLFKTYKFRTMIKNAEHLGPKLTRKNDMRITKLGQFLRRTSLDEFPQFVNVLKGDMSVVGPRPEIPHIVKNYNEWQKEVLKVRPGVTGLAQISGRQELPIPVKLRMDLYYIQNYSIVLDLKILFRTVWVSLTGKGAY
jgi:exopolysaccharide biosynthesis polyprenyl glycosylphosphotransferase